MSLIGTEIRELRKMNQQMIDGTLDPKVCLLRLKIYRETAARSKMILDMHKLATLKGLSLGKLTDTGLFGRNETLQIGLADISGEFIKCQETGKNITRADCLDYSGSSEHTRDCMTCKQFNITRSMFKDIIETVVEAEP